MKPGLEYIYLSQENDRLIKSKRFHKAVKQPNTVVLLCGLPGYLPGYFAFNPKLHTF